MKKFLSRKLLAFLLTGIVAPALAAWGVPEGVVTWLIGLGLGYIGVQGAVDTATAWKGSKKD